MSKLIPADGWFAVRLTNVPPHYEFLRVVCFVMEPGKDGPEIRAYLPMFEGDLWPIDACGQIHGLIHENDVNEAFKNECQKAGESWWGRVQEQ